MTLFIAINWVSVIFQYYHLLLFVVDGSIGKPQKVSNFRRGRNNYRCQEQQLRDYIDTINGFFLNVDK